MRVKLNPMAFRFNFGDSEPENDESESKGFPDTLNTNDAVEICVENFHIDMLNNIKYEITKVEELKIKRIPSSITEQNLASKNSSLLKETKNAHSDLIPGVYEGGFKIWECSLDLIEYLSKQKICFKDLDVLEIGCGAGLPGIYAYLHGAKVTFQDYNSEVLNYVTIANVLLNSDNDISLEELGSKCSFISGDWSKLSTFILERHPQKFDIILTAETIYSLDSQHKLLNLMKDVLKKNGVAYLAAKTFYFGVGGGTREFERIVLQDSQLVSSVCHVIETGVQREILQLKFQ